MGRAAAKLTFEAIVAAPIDMVWRAWTTPDDIVRWNTTSPDWHTTKAAVNLREGGAFSSRMESRDGKMGFDFAGVFTRIVEHALIESSLGGRVLLVEFFAAPGGVVMRESFDTEPTHSVEHQVQGWQAILDNVKRHVEARGN